MPRDIQHGVICNIDCTVSHCQILYFQQSPRGNVKREFKGGIVGNNKLSFVVYRSLSTSATRETQIVYFEKTCVIKGKNTAGTIHGTRNSDSSLIPEVSLKRKCIVISRAIVNDQVSFVYDGTRIVGVHLSIQVNTPIIIQVTNIRKSGCAECAAVNDLTLI
ncbi:hypothetical protein SDC9_176649 [bioreactor metagenome]|uniref:Uncharacterized protein n=1 Tax=bioreactor metagenome TaxID=1076179 RepID=A0A645GQM6_9ZZZZ